METENKKREENARRVRLFRRRAAACTRLRQAIETGSPELDEFLWDALLTFQDYPFQTAKGLRFSYTIRGGELFFTRKEKSITKATVLMSFHRALELMEEQGRVTGPKKLGTFGASYLYPVFIRLGVIATGRAENLSLFED